MSQYPFDETTNAFLSAFFKQTKEMDRLSIQDRRKRFKQTSMLAKGWQKAWQASKAYFVPSLDAIIEARLFLPPKKPLTPLLIYMHPGGWVYGSLEESALFCHWLASQTGCCVASIDYRLAPEAPFPFALLDGLHAAQFFHKNAFSLGLDPNRIFVVGSSAGANLAAAMALISRDAQQNLFAGQILLSPILTSSLDKLSFIESKDQVYMTYDAIVQFWKLYLPDEGDGCNPYASPLMSMDCHKLPFSYILMCEYDPLRVQAERYARRLEECGVEVVSYLCEKNLHDALSLALDNESKKAAQSHMVSTICQQIARF